MNFKHILVSFLIIRTVSSCSNAPLHPQSKTIETTGVPTLSTTVHWRDSSLDLGNIPMGDSVVFYFRFTNTGPSPLILQNILTGCSCTSVYPNGTAIATGTTDSIKVVFDTRKSVTGFISKSLLVKGNLATGAKVLRYRAVVTGHKALRELPH